jgi:pyruvate dehydrogenase E2 component (dihydrolipoamide acetyltransferase)
MQDPETGQVDLSALTLRRPETKSLAEIVDEFEVVSKKIKAGRDQEKEKTRRTFQRLPTWLVGPVLDLISFLTYALNLDLSRAGIPRDLFGSAMITNVGSLGLKTAYVPLVPYSRVPLLIAVGAVERKPVVDADGSLRAGQTLGLHATFDHRILDGAHAATMARTVQAIFADPWSHLDPLER